MAGFAGATGWGDHTGHCDLAPTQHPIAPGVLPQTLLKGLAGDQVRPPTVPVEDPASAHPSKATAGPGSSWPPTPSSGWPATSPTISAGPGRNQSPNPTGSPQPASAAGFGTSARRPPFPPTHQNPHDPAQDAHPDPKTASPPTNTRSARTPPTNPAEPPQVKNQAQVPHNAG